MADRLATYREVFSGLYEIEREHAREGIAIVLLGRSAQSDQQVLLKVLRPELVSAAERFVRDARFLSRMDHPLIVPIIDSGRVGDVAYMATPFIDGESLRQVLARQAQVSVEDIVCIGRDVAEALSYAHAQGVLHRDIKPANILLTRGRAMLTDFTLNLMFSDSEGDGQTDSWLIIGTRPYMSPEQALGERDLDTRCDIYSLAVVLREMLTGEAATVLSDTFSIAESTGLPGDARANAVEAVVRKAMSVDRAARHQTAAEFRDELTAAISA